MSKLIWKVREAVSKLVPFVIVGAIAFGGYSLYRKGTFRNGIGSTVSHALKKIPYFGSRFSHYTGGQSYATAPRSYRKAGKRGVRKHHGRRSRRHHRRHR